MRGIETSSRDSVKQSPEKIFPGARHTLRVTQNKKDLESEDSRSGKNKTGCVLLSQGLPLSTIAAEALHFCVRYGNRCFLLAMATGKSKKSQLYNIGKTAMRTYALDAT